MASPLTGGPGHTGAVRMVEIVGPAGAGKTTLWNNLRGYPELFSQSLPPIVWTVRDAPFFVKNLLRLVPLLARLRCAVPRREAAWMATLEGWAPLLMKEAGVRRRIVVLDQGPVFLITRLRLFGPPGLRRLEAEPWWDGIIRRWAAALDVVVWLDTCDERLIDRIRTRPDEHEVKDSPDEEISAFLARYRQEYGAVISRLAEAGVDVLKIDTGVDGPAEVAARMSEALGPGRCA
jgi:hypothetical protein